MLCPFKPDMLTSGYILTHYIYISPFAS